MKTPMIAKFCSATGISHSTISKWLGLHRATGFRHISGKNKNTSRYSGILSAFIRVWLEVENKPILDSGIDEDRKLLIVREKILEYQRELIGLQQSMSSRHKSVQILRRRLCWIDLVTKESAINENLGILHRLNEFRDETRKLLNGVKIDINELNQLDIRHIEEKIALLQNIENQLIRK